ncbi:Rho termination factor N-terminal domain-containing protein, partial [Mycolicibacterium psychrotolerans]|uniref:Rho termination factor N-terminal domain-containing protein n=1 Tax=Mycolicibacterium psychrotolerans TaxID=216929 RepID=UPI0021F2B565
MTDTDLITAGGGSDSDAMPTAVATDTPAAPAAAPARRGALTSLVLPELRAMAKEIGIEGASGMRKSELIAAIRERRGEKNSGAPAAEAAPSQPAPAADRAVERREEQRRSGRRGRSEPAGSGGRPCRR